MRGRARTGGSRPAGDAGQVSAFIVILTTALVLCVGLVYEGGQALGARNRATLLAQEAARAGAQEIDWTAYRAGDGVRLDRIAAASAARAFLAQAGVEGSVAVDSGTVAVTCSIGHVFALLPLPPATLEGSAEAAPFTEAPL